MRTILRDIRMKQPGVLHYHDYDANEYVANEFVEGEIH
jgi:hypothetical protein